MEAGGIASRRKDLLAGLTGEVTDIGAGTGPSFCHYPSAVTQVLAVEPEPRLRARATAARAAPVPIEVAGGTATALPADASYEALRCRSCCAQFPTRAPGSPGSRRVLRPGGTLCSFEHVRAALPAWSARSGRWGPRYGRACSASSPAAISKGVRQPARRRRG
jgi:SAM-dependent methyltransferase